ncbi:MAG TPA: hypothetical protein VK646_08460 [Actinomycetota bacterium]|nr:hypothetical protein [Actinomycetota bacterium]
MVPSAYLRVFQPLDAFEREEQLHWERYLVERSALRRPVPRFVDHPTGDGVGLLAPAGREHAEIRVVEGRTFVSPQRMRLRILAAAVAFREAQPMDLWDVFVTKKEARRARRELIRLRRRTRGQPAFVHQSPWHVPIRWFLLFKDDERRIIEDEEGRLRLRYVTTVRRAMRRAENAVHVLRGSDLGPIGELLLDLHQWLSSFEPRSLVELDYGGLCDFLTWDELDDDHSAADLREALEALEKLEYGRSADVYQSVLSHWAEVRSREILN